MATHRVGKWLIGSAALALGLAPVLVMQVNDGVAGATTTTDSVTYAQSATSSSYSYVPGNGSTPTSQPISPSGSCKTPTVSSAPLLSLSALVYKANVGGVPYTGPSSAGTVGTSRGRTGVCNIPPSYAINQNESLFFALGSNALVAGRTFLEAKVPLVLISDDDEGDDSAQYGWDHNSTSTTTATLIERIGSTVVGTQSVTVPRGDGDGDGDDTVTADTGQISGGFTSLEVRVATSTDAAVSVVGTSVFSLLLLPQTITFTNTPPTSPIVGDSYTVMATGGGSGNPVTFSVDGSSGSGCTVDKTTGVVNLAGPAGICVIDANQAGNATYAPAPQVQQPVTVGLAPQAITFTSTPPSAPVVGDTYAVMATGGASELPVTFSIDVSSTSGCVVDPSGLVTFDAPTGSCIIDANQAGNSSYSAAPQVQQDITVYQVICGQQTISTQSTDGTSGQVSTSFTFQDINGMPAPKTVCKTYTAFTASANNPVSGLTGNQTVQFASNPLATAHVTATITWAVQSFCTPDGSGDTPQCPPTYVSFDDGVTWQPQTYCSSAQTAGIPWCTTGRSYAYSSQGTTITETWDGYGDPVFHHG